MAPRPRTAKDFWKNVNTGEPHECWEWEMCRNGAGYGMTTFHSIRWASHRLAYFLHTGEHPGKQFVLHKCDNPPCCNPHHLYLGDAKQNKRDEIDRNRTSRGERHPNSVLTDDLVREMRNAYSRGETQKNIAKRIGVHEATVSKAMYQGWSHIPLPEKPKRNRGVVDVPRVLELHSQGLTQKAIAAEIGIAQTRVSFVLTSHGIRKFHRIPAHQEETP